MFQVIALSWCVCYLSQYVSAGWFHSAEICDTHIDKSIIYILSTLSSYANYRRLKKKLPSTELLKCPIQMIHSLHIFSALTPNWNVKAKQSRFPLGWLLIHFYHSFYSLTSIHSSYWQSSHLFPFSFIKIHHLTGISPKKSLECILNGGCHTFQNNFKIVVVMNIRAYCILKLFWNMWQFQFKIHWKNCDFFRWNWTQMHTQIFLIDEPYFAHINYLFPAGHQH